MKYSVWHFYYLRLWSSNTTKAAKDVDIKIAVSGEHHYCWQINYQNCNCQNWRLDTTHFLPLSRDYNQTAFRSSCRTCVLLCRAYCLISQTMKIFIYFKTTKIFIYFKTFHFNFRGCKQCCKIIYFISFGSQTMKIFIYFKTFQINFRGRKQCCKIILHFLWNLRLWKYLFILKPSISTLEGVNSVARLYFISFGITGSIMVYLKVEFCSCIR